MIRTLSLLAALVLAVGSIALAGRALQEETPPVEPPALGLNLGTLVRIDMPLGEESTLEATDVEFYATFGWDGPRGGVELLLPASHGILGTEVALDAMLPAFPHWRLGAGVLLRPFSLELSGIRLQAAGGTKAFAVTLGGVITPGEPGASPLDLQMFIGVRINPWW